MGVGEKSNNKPMDGWIIALRRPLKPILTKAFRDEKDEDEEENSTCTTPTSEESRIPRRLTCPPPAPKKRKSSSRCHQLINNGVREFFNPPDLESVFIRRVET
ncbi:cyclin-dependent protein kinase inhibitor SMR6-like [Lycium ferocissimum]|uniref:cyclin-dependent protein kinase inhibitor SMR6-like n=1 Tax=Lycium ferocissimum TaxID=112874 RepID=UPI002814FDA6|nr:cyclin-dependent protein kinase inhibitor SMR6-like [Lycium ferocissimum]